MEVNKVFFLISGHASLSSSADYPGNPWHHLQPSMIKMISAFRDGGGGDDDDVVAEEEGDGDKGLYLGKGNVSYHGFHLMSFLTLPTTESNHMPN